MHFTATCGDETGVQPSLPPWEFRRRPLICGQCLRGSLGEECWRFSSLLLLQRGNGWIIRCYSWAVYRQSKTWILMSTNHSQAFFFLFLFSYFLNLAVNNEDNIHNYSTTSIDWLDNFVLFLSSRFLEWQVPLDLSEMQERSRGWTFSPRHRRYESLLNHFPNISQERCLHFALGFPYVTSLSCLFKHRTRLSKCAGGGMGGGGC